MKTPSFFLRMFVLFLFVGASVLTLRANGITVTNVTTSGQNTAAGTNNVANFSLVEFDLAWNSSWRVGSGPSNYDAAWCFAKFMVGSTNPVLTGVTTATTAFTVSTSVAANLRVGMPVYVSSGTGALTAGTRIGAVNYTTGAVTLSSAPSTALNNATLTCQRIWEHASLNNSGHTVPAGFSVDAGLQTLGTAFNASTNPGVGAFIYRSANALFGNVSLPDVKLQWNYGAQNVFDNAVVSVRVFAIEMVFVPQASFFVGSGAQGITNSSTPWEGNSLTNGSWTTGNSIPFQITSEGSLAIAQTSGSLGCTGGITAIGGANTLAAAYPKGFGAFYCMKYEISQGQYRDFLNTLTYTQQTNRASNIASAAGTSILGGTNRNGLQVQVPGVAASFTPATIGCNLAGGATYNQADDGEWIACNFLSYSDLASYLDWSGLRPMTELEYEKACRGPNTPVAFEYPWGSTSITQAAAFTASTSGTASETISTASANACYGNAAIIPGPVRVGAFATASTSRRDAGSSWYGIMELCGNLWERTVSIHNNGRGFTGQHGDGTVSANGHATTTAWPGLSSGEVTGVSGMGLRGGGWAEAVASGNAQHQLTVSSRINGLLEDNNRYNTLGGRGVRTAP